MSEMNSSFFEGAPSQKFNLLEICD